MQAHPRDAEFGAFLSYARSDDVQDGRITVLRERLEAAVRMRTGQAFPIFQDREDIFGGERWRTRIDTSIDKATLLIAVVTPSFLTSDNCRGEVSRFLARERSLERSDLIIPILYVATPGLANSNDGIAAELNKRQFIPWKTFRFEDIDSTLMRKEIDTLALQIMKAIERSRTPQQMRTAELVPADEGPDHRPPPNWVAGVAACNVERIIADLLPFVTQDVEEMNKLSPEQRRWCRFSVNHGEEGSRPFIRVGRVPEPEQDSPGGWSVTFKKFNNRIAVHGLANDSGDLVEFADPEWGAGSSSCRVRFNGRLYKIREFNKVALEALFFE